MPQYVVLVKWTDQGVREAKDALNRRERFAQIAQGMGCQMGEAVWTLGRYDVVARLEAPDDETASAFALRIAATGAGRTETLRAFTAEEMQTIIGKLG